MSPFRLDGPYLVIASALIVVLLLHGWLIKRRTPWLGALVPVCYVGLVGFLAASGRLPSVIDYIFAALGLLGLLLWWSSVRRTRSAADVR